MDFKIKELGNGAVEVALGTGATIVGLHAVRKMPKYAGWVLLGAGILGYVVAGGFEGSDKGMLRVTKTVSVIAASVGAVSALNRISEEGGVPAVTGIKGTINKVVPSLGGVDGGMGNIEYLNENLLGQLQQSDLNELMEPELAEQLLGAENLM